MGLQVKNLTDLVIASSGQNSNISKNNTTWAALTDEGADVFLPAGKAKQVFINERSDIRLLSDASEGYDRTFKILHLYKRPLFDFVSKIGLF